MIHTFKLVQVREGIVLLIELLGLSLGVEPEGNAKLQLVSLNQ